MRYRWRSPEKSESEIASKKRAEYRRRYALLDSVVEQVPATFKR